MRNRAQCLTLVCPIASSGLWGDAKARSAWRTPLNAANVGGRTLLLCLIARFTVPALPPLADHAIAARALLRHLTLRPPIRQPARIALAGNRGDRADQSIGPIVPATGRVNSGRSPCHASSSGTAIVVDALRFASVLWFMRIGDVREKMLDRVLRPNDIGSDPSPWEAASLHHRTYGPNGLDCWMRAQAPRLPWCITGRSPLSVLALRPAG
jgi:hypothetical protein